MQRRRSRAQQLRAGGGLSDEQLQHTWNEWQQADAAARAYKNPALLRLQQKREFDNVDAVKSESRNCPLSYGFDDNGVTPKGPWNKVSYEQYKRLDGNRPKNNPNYNKVTDPADNTAKIMMTADGQFCARDRPSSEKQVDLEKTVKRLEALAMSLTKSRSQKQKELARDWRKKENTRMQQWYALSNTKQWGPSVGFDPTRTQACNPSGMSEDGESGSNEAWEEKFGRPKNPKAGGLEASEYEKRKNKWYRPFIIPYNRGDDDVYCAADDSTRTDRFPVTYHHLRELRDLDTDELPKGSGGKVKPYGRLYQDMAFCAQQQTEADCISSKMTDAPLGGKRSASGACRFYKSMYGENDLCMPRDVHNKRAAGSKKAVGRDNYSQLYKRFAGEEQKLINSRKYPGYRIGDTEDERRMSGKRFTGKSKGLYYPVKQ